MRHNALRDSVANVMKEVCTDVKVEPALLPVNPNDYSSRTNTSDGARLDISACGIKGTFERTFIDIRVSHPHAPSNVTLTLKQVYERNEKEKNDLYRERVIQSEKGSFYPMVFLTTGGAGPECSAIMKELSDQIADKRQEPYSSVINHLRVKLRFALLKSTLIAIRGTRGKTVRERMMGQVSLNTIPKKDAYET